ncbi:MAG: LCP family protein [Christensenella sp.]|nr:LCP family protein [Christensenella sp.]
MKQVATRERTDRNAIRKKLVIAITGIAVCIAAAILIGTYLNPNRSNGEPKGNLETRFTPEPVVEYNGNQYHKKNNLTAILLMGTDHYTDETTGEDSFRNGGQADFLVLIVIDDQEKSITPIQIDRDTLAEVTILGVPGNETGTRLTQICLAHGFGDGGKQSCALQSDAVSRLLYGVSIPYYVAMSMDGISTLNDAVGGVTVTITDDFSKLDPQMKMGATIVLNGTQAEYFVRNRMEIGVGTNQERGKRQTQYWDALVQLMDQRLRTEEDTDFLHVILKQVDPYLTSNMANGRLINEIWKDKDYTRQEMVHPQGEYTIGEDGFVEFHVNETALEALVMQLFYQKAS